MKRFRNWFTRKARAEEGTATIPFVLFFPFFIALVIASLELGLLMVRQVMLERGLDMAVRDLRLGIWNNPTFNGLKQRICNNAGIIPDCMSTLHLELRPVSKVTWEPLSSGPTCVNRVEDPNPDITFNAGVSNEMMLIRACVKFKPMFPSTGLGFSMPKDSAGEYALVSASAFVNEPRLGS
jgi:Flp pilus assembly protein TadG